MTRIEVSSCLSYLVRIFVYVCLLLLLECHFRVSAGQSYTLISSGFIGCFNDKKHVLTHHLPDWNNNTGNLCKSRCLAEGYTFAGTKNGFQCYCGHYRAGSVFDDRCTNDCPGHTCEKCGGSDQISLFYAKGSNISCRSTPNCKKNETCKEDKGGVLCISKSASHNPNCSYTVTTKAPSVTSANMFGGWGPAPIKAATSVATHQTSLTTSSTLQQNPISKGLATVSTKPSAGVATIKTSLNTTLQQIPISTGTTNAPNKTSAASSSTNSGTKVPTNHMEPSTPLKTSFITNDLMSIETNDRQYFICNRNLSYLKAKENCKMLKADIVSYTSPVQYITLQRNLSINGTYWVGGGAQNTDNKCLVLDSTGGTSLYSTTCAKPLYSICSRVANISEVLNEPKFVELIKNMTVNSRKTTKMKRKLNCSDDKRTSAKAIGAIVGVGVISIIGGLLFLSDLQNVIKVLFDREKKD